MLRVAILILITATLCVLAKADPLTFLSTQVGSHTVIIGTTNPGRVYLVDVSASGAVPISPVLGFSVTSLVNFNNTLYAAVITSGDPTYSRGLIYMRNGDRWVVIGNFSEQVYFLIVFKGELYAGTGPRVARLYKWVPANRSWVLAVEYTRWNGFRSAFVYGDWLYLGDWLFDKFARWDGHVFQDLGNYGGSCIYSFEIFGRYVYAGAYAGVLYRIDLSSSGLRIERIWREPSSQYIWSLKQAGGYLYIGTAWAGWGVAEGRLYRFNGSGFQLVRSWAVSNIHEGVISLASDGRYLYVGLGAQAIGYPSMTGRGKGSLWIYDLRTNRFVKVIPNLDSGVQTILPRSNGK